MKKIGPMRPIGPITKALLKPLPTLSPASFTRRITCWISNSASWRSSFWSKAALQNRFIMPVSRRGRDSEAFRLRSVNGLLEGDPNRAHLYTNPASLPDRGGTLGTGSA